MEVALGATTSVQSLRLSVAIDCRSSSSEGDGSASTSNGLEALVSLNTSEVEDRLEPLGELYRRVLGGSLTSRAMIVWRPSHMRFAGADCTRRSLPKYHPKSATTT